MVKSREADPEYLFRWTKYEVQSQRWNRTQVIQDSLA
jgi:hypothetical protein